MPFLTRVNKLISDTRFKALLASSGIAFEILQRTDSIPEDLGAAEVSAISAASLIIMLISGRHYFKNALKKRKLDMSFQIASSSLISWAYTTLLRLNLIPESEKDNNWYYSAPLNTLFELNLVQLFRDRLNSKIEHGENEIKLKFASLQPEFATTKDNKNISYSRINPNMKLRVKKIAAFQWMV